MSILKVKMPTTNPHIKGFTITELLIGIAIIGILTSIAAPSLSQFMIQSRVDNEISEIHRLMLSARNAAINTGKSVTVCPLSGKDCGTNWKGELSVFTNNENTTANNKSYDSSNDELIKIKGKVATGDKLNFSESLIVFAPTGRLISGGNGTFSYCPKDKADLSRGIDISLSGRVYATSDTDKDGKDETRDGTDVKC
ncbi:MAG: GspH/FimT family pseudopilin [Cognaticolwellia sp.]